MEKEVRWFGRKAPLQGGVFINDRSIHQENGDCTLDFFTIGFVRRTLGTTFTAVIKIKIAGKRGGFAFFQFPLSPDWNMGYPG